MSNEEIDLNPEWRLEIRGREDAATNVSAPISVKARFNALRSAQAWITEELSRMAQSVPTPQ